MDPYGSHVPVLKAIAPGIERVVEFGGGKYSTPTFLEFPDLKKLVTVETNPVWARAIATDDPRHSVITERPYALTYDLILVDDADTMHGRIATLRYVSESKPLSLVVIHDYEHEQYREAACFDHVAVSDSRTPWTAVAWNEGSPHGGEWLHRVVAEA